MLCKSWRYAISIIIKSVLLLLVLVSTSLCIGSARAHSVPVERLRRWEVGDGSLSPDRAAAAPVGLTPSPDSPNVAADGTPVTGNQAEGPWNRSLRERITQAYLVLANITKAMTARNLKECADMKLNIGYSSKRHRAAAYQAVANALFLSNMWALRPHPGEACQGVRPGGCAHKGQATEYTENLIAFERIRTSVLADSDIFAAGGCFGSERMSSECNLTCIYARRSKTYQKTRDLQHPDYRRIVPHEISSVPTEVFIPTKSEPEWFTGPREMFYKVPVSQRSKEFGFQWLEKPTAASSSASGTAGRWDTQVRYEHGYWTTPYFDCEIGGEWMISFMMPVVVLAPSAAVSSTSGAGNRTPAEVPLEERIRYVGTTGVDIELSKVDIDQCEHAHVDGDVFSDALTSTHFCPSSTQCVHVPKGGFRSGSYRCLCKDSYYLPSSQEDFYSDGFDGASIENDTQHQYVNGTRCFEAADTIGCLAKRIEETYFCIPCHSSCKNCTDGKPCSYQVTPELMHALSALNLFTFLCTALLVVFVICYRRHKVVKAASWPFLVTALLGAMLLYGAVMRPLVSLRAMRVRCVADVIFSRVGFVLLYGSIFLKIWRIQQMISPTFLKMKLVRGQTLNGRAIAHRLIILILVTAAYLLVWMLVLPPELEFVEPSGFVLSYHYCVIGPFGYASSAAKLGLMLWGAYLCLRTRHVAAQFTDSRELNAVIYTFIAVTTLGITLEYTLATGKYDHQLLIDTLRTQLTVTVTLAVIFVPKLRDVYRSSGHYQGRKSSRRLTGKHRRPSQHSINSIRNFNRSSRAGSILSRSRSPSTMNAIPLERRASRMTINSVNSRMTINSMTINSINSRPSTTSSTSPLSGSANGHGFLQRSASVAPSSHGRMTPHMEMDCVSLR